MGLRIISPGDALPYSWGISSSCTFESGTIMQLVVEGNGIFASVSNGLAPIGIADDHKSKAFTANSWDETVLATNIQDITTGPNNTIITTRDIKMELENPNVVPSSFVSTMVPVQLIPRNGVIVFPAGTVLNYDMSGGGFPDSIKTNVRYTYQIPNIVGDDTTAGSHRVTVWFGRGLYEVTTFETNQQYFVNSNLFVSEQGLLTTRQPTPNHPSVAICTAPPTAMISSLQFLWL